MAVAVDAQGAEVVKPWVEKAGATYRTLLDRHNAVAKSCGLKYVPVGILLDEEGRLVRAVGSVNIGQESFRRELVEWATTGAIPEAWIEADRHEAPPGQTPQEKEADARFQLAIALLEQAKKAEAAAELKRAYRLDPENWLIRKQLWAIEHPEAFYEGDVDYGWQKAQIERENTELMGRAGER